MAGSISLRSAVENYQRRVASAVLAREWLDRRGADYTPDNFSDAKVEFLLGNSVTGYDEMKARIQRKLPAALSHIVNQIKADVAQEMREAEKELIAYVKDMK